MQHILVQSYQTLRSGRQLDRSVLGHVQKETVASFQLASLTVQLIQRDLTVDEADLVQYILSHHPKIAAYVHAAFPQNPWIQQHSQNRVEIESELTFILQNTSREKSLGPTLIKNLIQRLTADQLCLDFLATWLMTVCVRGLSPEDMESLTFAMRDSGQIYDYRNRSDLKNAKIIRRYPTGALSEKTALILPSLLAAVSDRYPIASPFIVARSLGYTGGTWDKLKSIPGFVFPHPGDESVSVMKDCSVAMSVTIGDFNPADRKLYQFRSTTGTIECHELLVSSIASKMLALPADHLLMDVRYGEGAFVTTKEGGQRLGDDLARLISKGGSPCTFSLTDTAQPNGCAIGNALEVLEAIAVMNHRFAAGWDARWIEEQREIVLGFFELLMDFSFHAEKQNWRELGRKLLSEGQVFESFLKVLRAHKVDAATIEGIRTNPSQIIGPAIQPVSIVSKASGILRRIDQKKLGNIVNFHLGGGGNDFVGQFTANAGVILRKRLGDAIHTGETLCLMYQPQSDTNTGLKITEELASCFEIESGKAMP